MDSLSVEPDDRRASLTRSARAFATRCHGRQRRFSDGAPFIEHPLEVAGLLRDADCSDVMIAAALLHDVVEDTDVSVAELRALFGAAVAELVEAVSDSAAVDDYRLRKQLLRGQVRDAGGDAALLFAADKIAKLRELPKLAERDPVRQHELRLEHYRASLAMLLQVAPGHPLVRRLASELRAADRPLSAR